MDYEEIFQFMIKNCGEKRISDDNDKYEWMPKAKKYFKRSDGEYTVVLQQHQTKDLKFRVPHTPCLEYIEGKNVVRMYDRKDVESYRQYLQETKSMDLNLTSIDDSGYESINSVIANGDSFLKCLRAGHTVTDRPLRLSTPLNTPRFATTAHTWMAGVRSIILRAENICKYYDTVIAERKETILRLNEICSEKNIGKELTFGVISEGASEDQLNNSKNFLFDGKSTGCNVDLEPIKDVLVDDSKDTSQNKVLETSFEVHTKVEANDFPTFSNDQRLKIDNAVNKMDSKENEKLRNKFNFEITWKDISTLQWDPPGLLNDQVINFYMNLLNERGNGKNGYRKVYAMNTFFYERLSLCGYEGVRRWTKKVDIFACDLVLVPIHIKDMSTQNKENILANQSDNNDHWCIAVIYMNEKTIKYYDSVGISNETVFQRLLDYIGKESLDKRKLEIDVNGWRKEHVKDHPKQENVYDCGVFTCMTAEFVCSNRPIIFNQGHMEYFRKKMVLEIYTGTLLR